MNNKEILAANMKLNIISYFCAVILCVILFMNYSSKFELQFIEQSEKSLHSSSEMSYAILMDPVSSSALSSLGGTSHWFHVLEYLLPNLDEAKSLIWGNHSLKVVYFIFQEKKSALNLCPFGRLMLTTILTGGYFEEVIIGYTSSHITIDKSDVLSLQNFYPVSFLKQSMTKPVDFMSSTTDTIFGNFRRSFNIIFTVKWQRHKHRFDWFDRNIENFIEFRRAVARQCNIEMNNSYDVVNYFSTMMSDQVIPRSTNGKQIFYDYYNIPKLTSLLNSSDDLNAFKGLLTDHIPGWSDRQVGVVLPAPITLHTPKRVLVYQRDQTRKIANLHYTKRALEVLLNDKCNGTNSCNDWIVDVISIDQSMSPCYIIDKLKSSTIYITPHGFQSTLFLFQPLASLLVEIHPFLFVKPGVFGDIQETLRNLFYLPRSYLFDGSEHEKDFKSMILYHLGEMNLLDTYSCLKTYACRQIAKYQNVHVSDHLIRRVAEFAHIHYP
jgi:hypothetical protein